MKRLSNFPASLKKPDNKHYISKELLLKFLPPGLQTQLLNLPGVISVFTDRNLTPIALDMPCSCDSVHSLKCFSWQYFICFCFLQKHFKSRYD
ncbi:ORFC hypothetical protein [Psittacine adenovirus 2]|nr:ORFC hypothetical protein [Psittacine adenovirus 2]